MGIRPGQRVLYLRRLRLIDGAPYMIETNYINLELCPRVLDYDFRDESLYRVLSYHNIFPCQGYESVGITYATDSEACHLQIESGDPLYFLTGVAKDQNGFLWNISRVLPGLTRCVFPAFCASAEWI